MNNKIENLLTTDYIYIRYYSDMNLLYKDSDYIYKNDILMINNKKKIYSTVSGKVLGITTINKIKYVVIENDYKNKVRKKEGIKRNINKYKVEELKQLIEQFNIVDNFDITSKVLIINGLDLFNTEYRYNTLLKEYTINILDCIDALIEIMNVKKCFLTVCNDDIDCINILVNNIGTYPKIDLKLFNNDNIIGVKEVLIDKLTKYKNKKYNIQYLNILDVLNIYNVLKKHIPVTTTYITLTGDMLDCSKIIKVNIGTNILDILKEYKIDKYDNIIINGLLNGVHIKNPNFIIERNIRSIYINSIKKHHEAECINCGLCVNICPININPKYMHFNKNKKSDKYKKECIKCGMCSYICPSKIDLYKKEGIE